MILQLAQVCLAKQNKVASEDGGTVAEARVRKSL